MGTASATSPYPLPLPNLTHAIAVMAIVNRTPDSFYDQGKTWALKAAIDAAVKAACTGAQIVDIGGVPFAPGHPLPGDDEADRVEPVVRALRDRDTHVLISVDTFHASVAQRVLAAGADIINDTTGLADPELASVVAEYGASIVLTHSLASPRTPYPRPVYGDIVTEVRDFLETRIQTALAAGISADRIIIDPGPDLNKSTVHTLELLRGLDRIADLGYPMLAALSRKDFIGESLSLPKEDRLIGSLAAASQCVERGARILRVHDVAETLQFTRMIEIMRGWRTPSGPLVHNAS
ncbi:dihydropteroate synthase [Devriesea agamarum]|uniref:dihydropteroate synthase n=1 Tax=Devriesea agamarum TaxID=472569 RepID=UPI00071C7543|nr:dihydropteroate synthase [Devriesea agamarum]